MKQKLFKLILLPLFLLSATVWADTKKVLFIGNSYTAYNNLPDLIRQLAVANGDILTYSAITPGGTTLEQHFNNSATLDTILSTDWDFVVLQEQSQRPAFEDAQVQAEVFYYAQKLDSVIKLADTCTKTMFYMTWGRKNGDAANCVVWPPVCTYEGMDSLLQLRYTQMAEENEAVISPVAKVWRYLRNNYPTLELYNPDESHPSEIGSYAAAASFYAVIFGKSPAGNSFTASLSTADAQTVQTVADLIVYDSLQYWRRFAPYPTIDSIDVDSNGNNTFHFTGVNPRNVIGYKWDFGDGSPNSYSVSATHIFTPADSYRVCLTIYSVCDSAVYCTWVQPDSLTNSIKPWQHFAANVVVYPNPTSDALTFKNLEIDCQYAISDLSGRVFCRGNLSKARQTINLPYWLVPGSYFITLVPDKGNSKTFKVTKK